MNLDQIMQNIDQVKNEELEESKAKKTEEVGGQPTTSLDDYTKQYFERKRLLNRKVSHGARGKVYLFTDLLVSGNKTKRIKGLKNAYASAKAEIAEYKNSRPELVEPLKQKYMEEEFLPTVEAIIMQTSPEELYNSEKSLNLLDSVVLLPVEASGNGYAKQYIKTAYLDRGILNNGEMSSPEVVDGIRQIRNLSNQVENRAVYLMAKRLKKKIDEGRTMATGDDYALLSRIVSFYN